MVIAKDFPTANYHACRVLDEYRFELDVLPEDTPINPSPWYGFRFERLNADSSDVEVILKYDEAPHRYVPKFSKDKKVWKELSANHIKEIDDYTLTMTIPSALSKGYISAQKILDESMYVDWIANLRSNFPFIQQKTIGFSVAKRPIEALIINPEADRFVVLLGRQHPPEVSGSVAFMAFVEALLRMKVSRDESSSEAVDRFFRHHAILFVPLLNPDGVQAGHWRHNLQGKDLNRDWFDASQPEIQSVQRYLSEVVSNGKQVVLHLDFHSTNRDVLYTQMPDDVTNPPNFAVQWLDFVEQRGVAKLPEYAPRPLTEQGTAKGFFFKTYGIPSITYEVGDESDLAEVVKTAEEFALATAEIYGSLELVDEVPYVQPCAELFCFMVDANGASLLSLVKDVALERKLGAHIAREQLTFKRQAEQEGWPGGQNYLTLEAHLIDKLGPEASNVHIGRSRQDLHGVARRMYARANVLGFYDALLATRKALLESAELNIEVVIPAYTHGVPSQPTNYAHVLSAFDAALSRDSERIQAAFNRLNQSQLGVAAGSGSGFSLDREHMASLLAFDLPIENSYDANFLSTADYKLEIASVITQSIASITKFISNVHAQQRNPRPWIYLAEDLTSGSSIMPQKRNPRELDRIRTLAAHVTAMAFEQQLLNHNVDIGMHDYRTVDPLVDMLADATSVYERFGVLVRSVRVDQERALAELARGFSTSTEIADLLHREVGIPFRSAHAYAKRLVEQARDDGKQLNELTDAEFHSIYEETLDDALAIPVLTLRHAINPRHFVAIRSDPGEPGFDAVGDAIVKQREILASDLMWLQSQRARMYDAAYRLEVRLNELAKHASD